MAEERDTRDVGWIPPAPYPWDEPPTETDRLAAWAPQAAALLRETVDGWDGGAIGAWTVADWDRWAARVRSLLAELETPDA